MHGHKIINQNALHFITLTVVGWVDVFSRSIYRDLIIESLIYCQKEKGLIINAYVIMSNHIHLMCHVLEPFSLSDTIRDFKKFTAKRILQEIESNKMESRKEWMLTIFRSFVKNHDQNNKYQFWTQDNRPIELESPKWVYQKLAYIHLNPVRNGLVEHPQDYLYSSARQYLNQQGLLDIELLDLGTTEGFISS